MTDTKTPQATPTTPRPPGRRPEKFTLETIIEALHHSRGLIAVAARLLHCSRKTIYNAKARHPEIADMIESEREFLLDTAELKLLEAVNRGEAWAICFFLKCQAKDRGYVERADVKVAGGVTLEQLVLASMT